MYEILIALLSLLMGFGVAEITRGELGAGRRYFQVICFGVLVIFAALILVQELSWMLMLGILLGMGLGFILRHPYFYLGLLGVMTARGFPQDAFALLVAMFGLSYCSLQYRKLSWKWLGVAAGLYVLPYGLLLIPDFVLFFSFYFGIFYGIAIGGFVHVARGLYSGT